MNPMDYRRRSPLVKWEVRLRTNPPVKENFHEQVPAADPLVEKLMLDFIKPNPHIRRVFSGWWVK